MYKKLISRFFKIILSLLIFYGCNTSVGKLGSLPQQDSIRCFRITQTFPMIDYKGKIVTMDTMVAWVYYYNDQRLFHSAYYYNFQQLLRKLAPPVAKDTNSSEKVIDIMDDSAAVPEIRYRSLVYTIGNRYGSLFDSAGSQFNKRVLIDSALRDEWTVISVFDPFVSNDLTLLSAHENSRSGTLDELYSFRSKRDTSLTGTVELTFSGRMKKGGFSFSKKLDSIKDSRLSRVRIINNSRYIKAVGFTLEQIEQYSGLEEVPVRNRSQVLTYFKLDKEAGLKK